MKRAILALLLLMALLFEGALAGQEEASDITADCRFTGPGELKLLRDSSLTEPWRAARDDTQLGILLPDGGAPQGVYVQWYYEPESFILEQFDAGGALIARTDLNERFPALEMFLPVYSGAARLRFTLPKTARIAEVCVYSKGRLPDSLHIWEPHCEDADIMLVVAHQDDEELWFGGLIPYYALVREKALSVVYMTSCSRYRLGEALNGLWNMGIRTYPHFMGYKDEYVEGGRALALERWGGEDAVAKALAQIIQSKRPEVLVTHDIKGEYGHPQHRATSFICEKALHLPGEHRVLKFYRHLGSGELTRMDWNQASERLGGLTPLETAHIGFSAHRSQHLTYDMGWGERYDNSLFSLVFSLVGPDSAKNDLFENIKTEDN